MFDLNVEVRWIKCNPTLFAAGFLIKDKVVNKTLKQYIDYVNAPHTFRPKTAFQWDDSLATGNELIDGEHKQLVKAINDFFEACYQNAAGEKLQKTLNFLNDYTIKHFFDEEQLQIKHNYPNYENHKKFHEGFKKVTRDLMVEFIQKGVKEDLIKRAKHDIGDVIIAHIKHEDMRLAAHIRGEEANLPKGRG
jgi:hemerythrin